MAVEAHNLNLFPSQHITNRNFMNSNQGMTNLYNTQMESTGFLPAKTMPEGSYLPYYQSTVCDSFPAKTSMNNNKSDSGLTYNFSTPRKRSRDTFDELNSFVVPQKNNNNLFEFSSFLGDDFNLQIQQQHLEIDRLIAQHTEKLRMEIEERRKRQSRVLVTAIQEGVMKKLKEKEEEVQRIGKVNWVLQERVKSLFMENQIWRDMAQTSEATANTLRNNLEQVLAHVSEERLLGEGGVVAAEDAESCCGSNGGGGGGGEEEEVVKGGVRVKDEVMVGGGGCGGVGNRMCRKCGVKEACVLLLPCRHLCLCTLCGSTLYTCPVCNSNMTANLHVNMS